MKNNTEINMLIKVIGLKFEKKDECDEDIQCKHCGMDESCLWQAKIKKVLG